MTRSAGLSAEYFQDIIEPKFTKRQIKAYQSVRDKWLDEHDLQLIETSPDGSCIFEALVNQLEKPDIAFNLSAAGLREYFLTQLQKALEKAIFHDVVKTIKYHEDKRWFNFFMMLPCDIENTLEELKNTRVWGRAQTIASLAGFLLGRPVIHFFISKEKCKYSVQGFDETGAMVEEGTWESLLSKRPLYLIHNGDGHYEGANPCHSGCEIDDPPAPDIEMVAEPDLRSVELCLPTTSYDDSAEQHTSSDSENIPSFNDPADKLVFSPISSPGSCSSSHSDKDESVNESILIEWLDETNQQHLNYAAICRFITTYDDQLSVGSSGLKQYYGGFLGALISALFRLRVPTLSSKSAADERLHDLVFIQETMNLLEKLAVEPVLAKDLGQALTFVAEGTTDFPAQVLLDVMAQFYNLTDRVWEQPEVLVVLASCYNQPILLLHPSALDNCALLIRPWHRPQIITHSFVKTAIKQYYPAVLVHDGGLKRHARWRAIIHDYCPAPVRFYPYSKITRSTGQAAWLSPVLAAVLQRRFDNAIETFQLIPAKSDLAPCHHQYLSFCIQSASTMSQPEKEQAILNITEQITKTGDELPSLHVGLALQKIKILRNLQQFDEAFQIIDELLQLPLPQYLKWRILLESVSLALQSGEDACYHSLTHLDTYPELVKHSRKLMIYRALLLEQVRDIDQSLVLLKRLQKRYRNDLGIIEITATLLGDRGRPRQGVELLNTLPGYRRISSACRTLAKLYASTGEFERSLNLITPLVTHEPSVENINTQLTVVMTSNDPSFLRHSRRLFDFARKHVPESAHHIDRCHFSVEVSLGEYEKAVKTLQSTHTTDEIKQRIRQEARYRKSCGEKRLMAGLCDTELRRSYHDMELLKLYTLWLEECERIDDAHRLYKQNRDRLETDQGMTRNAMIFYEKHLDKAPDFFDFRDIPLCPCCFFYLKHIQYQRQQSQEISGTVISVYRQHISNIYKKGCPHWLYQNIEQIYLASNEFFRKQQIFTLLSSSHQNHSALRPSSEARKRSTRQSSRYNPVKPVRYIRNDRSRVRTNRKQLH
ncbi:hypothetical protein ACWJJH_20325 [Endozoicomonadaceae bacterium StTr2]